MKIKLEYVNTVRKRTKGGVVTYYYHRITGKRIHGEPGTVAFALSYEEAGKAAPVLGGGSFCVVLSAYLASPEYGKLAESTRKTYRMYLEGPIREKWGNVPIAAFADRRIRGDVLEWRDDIARTSKATADQLVSLLRTVVTWAINRVKWGLEVNHLERIGRTYEVDRSEIVWTPEQTMQLLSVARDEMRWLIYAALYTLQRISDLRALKWDAYSEGRLILRRQKKTGKPVYISTEGPLGELLDSIPRRAETVFTSPRGKPWTKENFRAHWDALLREAGFKGTDLHFHDFRGTGATLIANAGRPDREIAALTGHSMESVSRILPKYVRLNAEHAKAGQGALNASWVGELQTKLQTSAENPTKTSA